MRKVILLLLLLIAFGFIYAQDSTFVTQQELVGYPWDDYFSNRLEARNVVIRYDGTFALQAAGTYMLPPPTEWLWFQSPIFHYTNNGTFQDVVLGPTDPEGALIDGDYTSIFQDRNGGYLALDRLERRLHSLNSSFQLDHGIINYVADSLIMRPSELYEDSDGYIVTGYHETDRILCAKFDYNNHVMWSYTYYGQNTPIVFSPKMALTSDNGYLFWGQNGTQLELMKVSQAGDSLWTRYINFPSDQVTNLDLIESNDYYYFACSYTDYVNQQSFFQIHRFLLDSPNVDIIYNMLIVNYFTNSEFNPRFLKLSDGNVLLTVALSTGQLIKFDANMNLLWSSNVIPSQPIIRPICMGMGKIPTRELPNGDLLTCANTDLYWLFLIRTDSEGQVTAIDDPAQPIPFGNYLSLYPNPFSSSLKIVTKRKAPANAEAKIYNIKGQMVGSIPLSDVKIEWKPKHLASGIYFVVLNVEGKRIEIHKTIYMKGKK